MPDNPDQPWTWCVVANVTREPHPEGPDGRLRLGLRRFAPGAKLYCFPIAWGDGGERIRVIGRHRGGSRLIDIVVATKWLANWRVARVFDPFVVRAMRLHWGDADASRLEAEAVVAGRTQAAG